MTKVGQDELKEKLFGGLAHLSPMMINVSVHWINGFRPLEVVQAELRVFLGVLATLNEKGGPFDECVHPEFCTGLLIINHRFQVQKSSLLLFAQDEKSTYGITIQKNI